MVRVAGAAASWRPYVRLIFYTCDPSTLHKPLISLDQVGRIRKCVVPRFSKLSIDFQALTAILCGPDLKPFAILGESAGVLESIGISGVSGVGVRRDVLCRNERLRPSFHAARLLPLSLSVARHPRDPDALLIAGADAHLEFRPQIGRDLCCEVAHPVRQAALARRAGKAFLDRPDEPGRPLPETTSSGSPRPRARRSWKSARAVSMSSFEPAISPRGPCVRPRNASRGDHRLALTPSWKRDTPHSGRTPRMVEVGCVAKNIALQQSLH